MQAKISKTLEAIIARTAFETSKRAITHSLKDFLTLEILREEGSLAHQILTSRLKDWEIHQICLRIESEIRSVSAPDSSRQNPEEFFPLYTRELQRLFAPMHHVSTAHALLHIVSDPHTITSQVLAMYHFDAQAIATELQKMTLEADQTTPPDTNFRPTPELRFIGLREPVRDTPPAEPALLDKFGTDLTYEARRGRIDPVVGREREMERIVQILSRRKKNNPILIGEAGVGKSAIVEGLALRMAADEVPATIRGKRLYSLDVSSLLAGTKYRGEFEERMQRLLEELRRKQDSILFIDEIHTIAGAGSTQGSLDTANILKPALARGELQVIGATTLDEYREDIESDPALERRFQKILVEPASEEETLLAKELSKWLFDENKGLIRIDMSEYSEKHNVARLIGSPPGYVGYGEGGQLTEAVRRHPYSVVLFDEIEKAHPEVFNTLLQIFDEGHLTDGSGRKVDFRNTVIILTSNVGSRAAAIRSTQVGYSTCSKSDTQQKAPQSEYRRALEETFAPEFLNRIDDIVIFRTLDLSDVERIIDLELKGLLSRTDRLGYKVEITDEAKRTLAAIGYQRKYGVRALRRTLLERIEEPLSGLIIDGKLHSGERVIVEPDGEKEVILRVA